MKLKKNRYFHLFFQVVRHASVVLVSKKDTHEINAHDYKDCPMFKHKIINNNHIPHHFEI